MASFHLESRPAAPARIAVHGVHGPSHGFESLEEQRLLLALDFAGGVTGLVSQPFRLRAETTAGWREHIPDFLAVTRSGVHLVDVRPRELIKEEDRVLFAATAEAALAAGGGTR